MGGGAMQIPWSLAQQQTGLEVNTEKGPKQTLPQYSLLISTRQQHHSQGHKLIRETVSVLGSPLHKLERLLRYPLHLW